MSTQTLSFSRHLGIHLGSKLSPIDWVKVTNTSAPDQI